MEMLLLSAGYGAAISFFGMVSLLGMMDLLFKTSFLYRMPYVYVIMFAASLGAILLMAFMARTEHDLDHEEEMDSVFRKC